MEEQEQKQYWCRRIAMRGDPDQGDYRPDAGEAVLLTLPQVERMDALLRRVTGNRECWVVCLAGRP